VDSAEKREQYHENMPEFTTFVALHELRKQTFLTVILRHATASAT